MFISHKQEDEKKALRVATLAKHEGFEVWLDVLDPGLEALGGAENMDPEIVAVLIASIIEMALLNCSHVIAVYTEAARESRWVPYEYGRGKGQLPQSNQAACWLAPNVKIDGAEYLHLGTICRSEDEVGNWLQRQARPGCIERPEGDPIPEESSPLPSGGQRL